MDSASAGPGAALDVCADAAAYVRLANAAAHRQGPVPVIGYPEAARHFAAFSLRGEPGCGKRKPAASPAADGYPSWEKRIAVAVGASPVALAAGTLFAAARSRDLVQVADWDELGALVERSADASVAVIAELGSESSAMRAAVRLPGTGCERNLSIGLLVGRDEAQLTWTVAKQLLRPRAVGGEHVLLYPERTSGDNAWANRRVLTGRAAEAFIGDSVNRSSGFLAITSSGRPDFISTGRGVLCGARTVRDSPAGGRPPCGYGLGCVKPGPRVPVSGLRADVLLLKSCQSGHLDSSIYGPDFLLALSALDSQAHSVIVTVRAPSTAGWEAELFEASLRAGMSHGAAVLLLNAAARDTLSDEPSYILLGDPESGSQQVAHAAAEPSGGASAVRILDTDRAPEPGAMVAGRGVSGYAPVRIGTRHGLVAWSASAEGLAPAIGVTAYGYEQARSVLSRARRTQQNLAERMLGGLLPIFTYDIAADARRGAQETALLLAAAASDPAAANSLSSAAAELEQSLDQIDAAAARLLAGDGARVPFPFQSRHEEHYTSMGRPRHEGRCWCGMPLMRQDLRPLDGSAGGRMKWSCFRCGLVALCAREALPLRWLGPSRCTRSGRVRHRFEISPPGRPVSGVIKLDHPWTGAGRATFEPGWSRFAVADSPVTVEIDEVLHEVVPNVYPTRAYVVYEGEVDHYRKTMEVTGDVVGALPYRRPTVARPPNVSIKSRRRGSRGAFDD